MPTCNDFFLCFILYKNAFSKKSGLFLFYSKLFNCSTQRTSMHIIIVIYYNLNTYFLCNEKFLFNYALIINIRYTQCNYYTSCLKNQCSFSKHSCRPNSIENSRCIFLIHPLLCHLFFYYLNTTKKNIA